MQGSEKTLGAHTGKSRKLDNTRDLLITILIQHGMRFGVRELSLELRDERDMDCQRNLLTDSDKVWLAAVKFLLGYLLET